MSFLPQAMQQGVSPQLGGWKGALQTISPLALSMAQGIRSGQGAAAYVPQGIAGMMAGQEKREAEAREQALSEAGENAGMSPTEKALFDSMDLGGKQSFLAQLMQERRARANRVGRAPSQADIANAYASSLGGAAPAPQAGVAGGMGGMSMGMPAEAIAPVAASGGLSLGQAMQPDMGIPQAAAPQEGALSFGLPPAPPQQPMQQPMQPQGGQADMFGQLRERLMADLQRIQQDAARGVPGAADILDQRLDRIAQIDKLMPQAGDMSEAEQEIARMGEAGLSRTEAIKIKEGIYKVITHPTTKEAILFDMQTFQPVRPMTAQTPAPVVPATPEPTPTPAPSPDLSFGPPYGGADRSFGIPGAFRGVANTAADTVGLDVPFPDVQGAQSDFGVMRENLTNKISEAYDGKVPAFLLQGIQNLTPKAGSVFEGPAAAQEKLEALGRNIVTERNSVTRQLSNRALSPDNRAKLENRLNSLETSLDDIRAAIAGFGAGGGGTTKSGLKYRVVQ